MTATQGPISKAFYVNMLTEEEAGQRQCRVSGNARVEATKDTNVVHVHFAKCAGGECMHWRWFSIPRQEGDEQPKGFCGLAGRP